MGEHQNASFKGLSEMFGKLLHSVNDNEDIYDNEAVVDCICGAKMLYVRARDAYKRCNTVYCDVCNDQLFNEMVYHCPRGYDDLHHKNGYDVCPKCAMKKKVEDNEDNEEKEEVLQDIGNEVKIEQDEDEGFAFPAQLAQIKEIMGFGSEQSDDLIKGMLSNIMVIFQKLFHCYYNKVNKKNAILRICANIKIHKYWCYIFFVLFCMFSKL